MSDIEEALRDRAADLAEEWATRFPASRFSGTTPETARMSVTAQEVVDLVHSALLTASPADAGVDAERAQARIAALEAAATWNGAARQALANASKRLRELHRAAAELHQIDGDMCRECGHPASSGPCPTLTALGLAS